MQAAHKRDGSRIKHNSDTVVPKANTETSYFSFELLKVGNFPEHSCSLDLFYDPFDPHEQAGVCNRGQILLKRLSKKCFQAARSNRLKIRLRLTSAVFSPS